MSSDMDDLNFLIADQKKQFDTEVHLDESSDFPIPPADIDDEAEVQIAAPPVSSSIQTISVDLNKDKFAAFMSILQMMKYSCQDLFIKKGRISQLNSKLSMIFDIDLRPIIGETTLVIGGIASKYDQLSTFKKQGVDVFLDVSPTGYTFRDAQSKIHNKRPVENFLEQLYLTEQQIHDRMLFDYNRKIFSYTWEKRMLDRIMNYAKCLSTPIMRVECCKDVIYCKAQSLDNASTTNIDILTLEDEVDDTSIDYQVLPFTTMCFINFIQAGIVQIDSELYHRVDPKPSAVLKLVGKIEVPNISEPITVKVYSGGWFSSMHGEEGAEII